MDQDLIVLVSVQTRDKKKKVPIAKSIKSKYKIRDKRWIETDRGAQGNNGKILVSIIGSSLSTPTT